MGPDRGETVAEDFSLKIIACETLKDELTHVAPGVETEYLKGMLHDHPDKMRAEISTILLGYGRCSNGTAGLKAGPHRLVLPAVDDCISLLLGSRRRYLTEFTAAPGTYYYTRGWVEELEDPYQEYLKAIPRIGAEKAKMVALMIMESYTRVVLVETGTYDIERCERYVEKVSAFYSLPIEKLQGDLRMFRKLAQGPWDGEFIVVEPGGVLDESVFWHLPSEIDQLPEDPDAPGAWGPATRVESACETCTCGRSAEDERARGGEAIAGSRGDDAE
jgi:hypothetical protein